MMAALWRGAVQAPMLDGPVRHGDRETAQNADWHTVHDETRCLATRRDVDATTGHRLCLRPGGPEQSECRAEATAN